MIDNFSVDWGPGDGLGLACDSPPAVHSSSYQATDQYQSVGPRSWEPLVYSLQSSRGAGPSRQATEYDYNKSNEKQVKETVSNMKPELAFSLQHSALCLGPQHLSSQLPPVHDWAQSTSAGARTPLIGS